MSDWVGIFIILISLFCGGFTLGVKWGEPMLNSSKALPPAQPDVPDTNVGNNDLISRQTAIDAVDNYIGTFDAIDVNFLDGLKTAKKLMMQLPSAQPTQLNTHNTLEALDCISRQAAIDALHGYFDGMLETDTWSPCDVYGLIEILPSADAVEVVRCKDCKHSTEWYRDKRRCFLWCEDGIDVFEDGYCSYWEQKDDEQNDG